MKIKLKDGTEFKVTSVKKTIDHSAYFNSKLNQTSIIMNVSENGSITMDQLKEILTPENVSEVTFVREIGNVSDNFVRFARISQNIDDFGDQIVIVLSKDEYRAIPEGYGAEE